MEYVHRETGAFGEEARKMLVAFIQDKHDTHWKYITAEDEPESPVPVCRSVVVKPSQPARQPKPRKETRPDSPMSLGEPEPILLEEPPRKKQRVEAATLSTLLNDLACTPSLSVGDSDVSETEDETMNEHNVIETAVHIQKTDTYYEKVYEEEDDKLNHKESKASKGSEEKKNEKQSKRNQSKTKTQEKKDEHRDTITKTHNEKHDETKKDKRKVIQTQNRNDEQIRKVTETQSDDRNKSETQNDKQNEASKDTSKENQNVTHKQNMIDEQTEKEIQNENEKEGNKETKSDKLKDTEKQCMTDKPRKPQNVAPENKEREESDDVDIDRPDVIGEESKKDKKTDKEKEMRVEIGGLNVKETQNKRENHEPKKKDKNTDKEQKTPQEKKEAGVNKVNLKSKENKTENQKGKDMSNKKVDKMKTKSVESQKKKITLKEYEARREDDKVIQDGNGYQILDDILQDITKTYSRAQPISSETIQVQNADQTESQPEFLETLNAVASITNDNVDQVVENACGVVSDCALELVEELVITEEIDNIIDRISEEIIEEKNLRKEQKSKRKAEKRKLEQNDVNEPNEKRLSECGENTYVTETEINNMGNDKDLENLKKIQGCKVVLNVGGARFETSILTLRKDSNSLLAKLFSEHSPIIPQGNSIFLDRDASHFKLILNYLRYDGDIMPAMLPREKRHLQELLKECEYYRIQGLYKIVKRRLKHLTELYGVDC